VKTAAYGLLIVWAITGLGFVGLWWIFRDKPPTT
jgi:hypothetical protein